MEHTPGPWSTAELFRGERIIRPDGGGYALAAAYSQRDKRGKPTYNADANARLIAAAPDLLAACKVWLGAVQNSLGLRLALTSLPENAGPALVEMLQEAIAKAKGE